MKALHRWISLLICVSIILTSLPVNAIFESTVALETTVEDMQEGTFSENGTLQGETEPASTVVVTLGTIYDPVANTVTVNDAPIESILVLGGYLDGQMVFTKMAEEHNGTVSWGLPTTEFDTLKVFGLNEDYAPICEVEVINVSSVEYTPASSFSYSVVNGGIRITGFVGNEAEVSIPLEIDGYPVTELYVNVFSDCTSLESVVIPSTVTTIYGNTFLRCSNLKNVVLPDRHTEIGTAMFYGCSSLTSVDIPDTVTSIEGNAFFGCTSLQSIDIPNGVTSIGSYAFYNCESLSVVELPAQVKTIEKRTFYGCKSIESIVIPNGASSIGEDAFGKCTNLKSVIIPASVVTFGEDIFTGCSSDLTIYGYEGSKAEIYASEAGYTFVALPAIEGPENCYLYTVNNEQVIITGYMGILMDVEIPEMLEGYPVIAIGDKAFYENTALKSVKLPEGVITIGNEAFSGCSSLSEVIMPDSVENIGNSAFYGCTSLSGIALSSGLTNIGTSAFAKCTSLNTIAIPTGAIVIGNSTFYGCTGLKNAILAEGVDRVGDSMFYGCTALESVFIPETVTFFGAHAFYNCINLKSVYIPNGVTEIASYAFWKCASLENVALPEGLARIGSSAFSECTSFTKIVIPGSLTSLNNAAFMKCTGVTEIIVSEGVTDLGGGHPFSMNPSLKKVSLPSTLKTISGAAFYQCTGLKEITIPAGVISVDVNTFNGCSSLERVTVLSVDVTFGHAVFENCTDNLVIYGKENSTAQVYANENGIAFVIIRDVIAVTGVNLNTSSLSLEVGETTTLATTVTPSNATNKEVNWTTNTPAVATVDAKGAVTAIGAGTATITATAADGSGKYASCTVTVSLPACDHPDTSRVQVGNPVYKMIADDDENHLATTYFSEICDLCSVVVIDGIEETTSEAHTFNEVGKCESCGYEKCLHTETIKEYVKTTYTQIADNTAQHQVTNYYKLICDNCEEVTDTNHTETLLAIHVFNDSNKCTLCNYVKPQETVEIVEPVLIHPALSTDEDNLPAYAEGDMTLVWGSVEGAVKYTVCMDAYWDEEWDEEIEEEETTEESFTIPEIDLEGGGIYRVRITAYDAEEESKSSDWYYFRIGAASYIWVKDELEVGYEADEYSISVCTSRNWQATVSDRSWITISATRGFASTSLDLEVTENTGDFPRTGTITFTNDAGGYALLTLIQEGNGSGNEGRLRIDYPEQGDTVEYDWIEAEWTNFIWTATYNCKVEVYDLTSGRTTFGPKTTTADYYEIPKSAFSPGHIYRLTVTACSVQGTEVAKATVVFKVEGSASGGGSETDSDDEVIETPEVPEGNTEILYSGIVNNSKIDMQDISVSWQEVIGSDYYAVALRDMTLYPDNPQESNVPKVINTTTQNLNYTIPSSKLVYGHQYRLWIAAHKTGVDAAINGKNILFTVESAPLKWDAKMSGDSKIVVNVLEGTPDANTPYLFIAEDSDGRHYPGNSTPNISAGATSATFRIKDLQMKRAKAYDLYVLPAGVSLTDDNRSQYFITDIVVPLWGGNMISAVRSGGTNVTYTKKLYLDEDIEIDWEGSYGVYNVEITAMLNGQIVFTEHCTEPELIDQDTPVTTTISKSRFSTAEDGDELEITVTVTPTTTEEKTLLEAADYKSSESSPWYGTCAIKAEVPNVDDMFAIDDIRFTVDMDLYEIYGEEYAKPDSLISICFIRDIELVSADNVFFRIGDSYTGKPKAITEYAGKIDMSFAAELPSLNTVTIYFPAYSLRDSSTGIMNVEIVSCSFVTGSDGALGNYRDLLSIQYGEQLNCFEGVFRRCFVAEYDSESSLFIVDTKSANVSSVSIYDPNGTVLSRSADSTVIAKTKFQGKETEKHLVFVWFENGNIGSFGFNTFVPYDEVSLNSGDAVEIYVSEELKSKWWYSDDFLQRNTWASQYTLATAKELFPTIYKKGHETYKYVYCDIAEWYELFTGYVAGSVAGVNTDVIFIESPEGAGPNTVIHTIAHETQHSLWSLNVCADGFFNEVMSQYIAANTIDLYNILSGTSYDRFSGNSLGIYDSYSTNQLYEKLTERTSGDYALYYYFGEFLNETIGIDGMRNILYRLSQQGEDSSAVDMENIIAKECGMNTFNGSSSSVMHSFSVWINTQ